MPGSRLTETSYIVLGLVEHAEPVTPYDLKQLAQLSTAKFCAVPHTQLYTECARLAREGLLSEQREEAGRRRRIYRLTEGGRQAFRNWLAEPTDELYEARDPGMLKLFFGGDPAKLAAAQLEAHRRQLEAYEQLDTHSSSAPRGWQLVFGAGIAHEHELIRFWSEVSDDMSQ